MSSFVAHALVGASPGLLGRLPWPQTCALVALAWLPDVDYLWVALGGARPAARVTHSLGFALGAWALALALLAAAPASWVSPPQKRLLRWASLGAPLSHLVMDALVGGAHGDPLLWPLSARPLSAPWGLLPAAGALRLDNVYLWRNLLIELGIFVPPLWMARRREGSLWAWGLAALVSLLALAWSASLAR
jgi:inner membrane protein